jgi:hypothetical protein
LNSKDLADLAILVAIKMPTPDSKSSALAGLLPTSDWDGFAQKVIHPVKDR